MIPPPSVGTRVNGWLRDVAHMVQNSHSLLSEVRLMAAYPAYQRRYRFLAEGAELADPGRRLLIVNFNTGHLKAQISALLAKALQLQGYTPVILTYSWCHKTARYYRAFGFRDVVYFDEYVARVPRRIVAAIEQEVAAYLAQPLTVQGIKALEYRGVNIGRATLSSIARTLVRGRIEFSDPAVQGLLRRWLPQTMQRVLAAEAVLDVVQPQMLLLHEKGYMAEGPVFEAALNQNVNTIYWCPAHRDDALVVRRYASARRFAHWLSLSQETCEFSRQMPWAAQHEHELFSDFRARYHASEWFLSRRYQDGKQVKDPDGVRRQLGLDPAKKTAVIFSHMTWDASFFHGEDLFEDYEDWLVETLKAACENTSLNWIVKLHPGHVFKSKAERIDGALSELATIRHKVGPLPPHVKLLEPTTDLNTFALFPVTDYCLTVRGTIGVEMACFGIPVLTGGTGRYSGLGFTIDSASREAYLATVRQLHTLPPLSPAQAEFARRYAYLLFLRRPARFTSFRTVFREHYDPSDPLFADLELRVRSFSELRRAPDLAAFAGWATASREEDFFLDGLPADGTMVASDQDVGLTLAAERGAQ